VKLSCLLCVFSAGLLVAQPAPDPAVTARKALDLLLGEKYSELFQMFSPELQKDSPEDRLGKLAATEIKPQGAVESIGEPSVRKAGPNTIVVIPVKFASRSVNFQAAINASGQVYIMNLVPGEVAWQRPAYSKPDAFHERAVTVGEGDWKLPGTLTVPSGAGPYPAIALVHGNGPNDRDETVGGSKIFKDLAEGLATRGIVVLRYEKRTRQYGAKMAGMHGTTVQEETVDDAVAAAALLRAQKEVDPRRVYVLGHSLGGYVAPRIAEEDGKLAGLLILAGNVRPLEDLLMEQSRSMQMNASQMETLKTLVARIKALEPADADAPPILGMTVPYLLDLKGYDPVAVAKKQTIPMLILQGERDYQVTMADFALWKAALGARKDVVFHSYPALNHLFIAGEGKSTEAEYRKPGHVAPEVIDDIAKWIAK
jgi:dienelactone hydrolase